MSTDRIRQLRAEAEDRLRPHYSLPAEVASEPVDEAEETASVNPDQGAMRAVERQAIEFNSKLPIAQQEHKSQPATQAEDNGGYLCLICGAPVTDTGVCGESGSDPAQPAPAKIPVAASSGSTTVGVTQWVTGNDTSTGTYTINNIHIPTADEMRRARTPETALITSIRERVPVPQFSKPQWIPDSRAFVTELNGKTLVTAQATVDPALFEKAFTPNEQFMWTQGRLVGADQPNRNGAFWTSGDLELGEATVRFGPLNWLHEGKHVIGTLAESTFARPSETADVGSLSQPHIAVVAPVWKWIYPEEASVIEMASDANKFWYSMECISKEVACLADGCGSKADYMTYIQGAAGSCDHMVQRSAPRHFVDPTFLGAAVIVPPVRPGWAEANAQVTRQAACLAEKAYDQAGRPDVSASEWELLMAQVVLAAA